MYRKNSQQGFQVIVFVLVAALVGVSGFALWLVLNKQTKTTESTASNTTNNDPKTTTQDSSKAAPKYIEWSFNGEKWLASQTAPKCEDPIGIASPMDASKASSVLYPGQIRGGDFKPHGGIGTENTTGNDIDVVASYDGYLYRAARYIEGGVVQYMFDFIHPCGIMFRLDHLATLTDEFQAFANQLPEPQVDDSRTHKFSSNTFVKKGTLIAKQVGNVSTKNAFFDLGVFDLRKQNEVSKTELYKTDILRISDKEQSFYALCWFDYVEGDDKQTIKALPARGEEGMASDYCK